MTNTALSLNSAAVSPAKSQSSDAVKQRQATDMTIKAQVLLDDIDLIEKAVAEIRYLYSTHTRRNPAEACKELSDLLRIPEGQIQKLIDKAAALAKLEQTA